MKIVFDELENLEWDVCYYVKSHETFNEPICLIMNIVTEKMLIDKVNEKNAKWGLPLVFQDNNNQTIAVYHGMHVLLDNSLEDGIIEIKTENIIKRNSVNMTNITNLEITDVEVWNKDDKNIGIRLSWSANIGWGQYTIGFYDGKWYVDSESMEDPKDREFGRLVLNTWLDSLKDNPKYMFGNIYK